MMTVVQAATDFTILARECPFCKKTHTHRFPMSMRELKERSKLLKTSCIQNVFPEFSADGREFLMTGICPKCWDNL